MWPAGRQVSSKGHAAFKAVAESLHQVVEDGHETLMAHPLSLQDLMPTDLDKFYRYSGSLTTPGCNEIVTWTVFDKPIYLSEIQVSLGCRRFHFYFSYRSDQVMFS